MPDPIKLSLTVLKESVLRRFEGMLDQERARAHTILTERAGGIDQTVVSAVNSNVQLDQKLFVSWRKHKATIAALPGQLFFGVTALVLVLTSALAVPAVLLSDQHWGWKLVEAVPLATMLGVAVCLMWVYCVHELLDTLGSIKRLMPTSSGVPRQVQDDMRIEAAAMLVLGPSAIHCRGGELLLSCEEQQDHDISYLDVTGISFSRDTGFLGIMSNKPTLRFILQTPAEAEKIAEQILVKAHAMGHQIPSMWIQVRSMEDIAEEISDEALNRFAASLPAGVFVRKNSGPVGKTLVVDMQDALAVGMSDRIVLFEGLRVFYTVAAA